MTTDELFTSVAEVLNTPTANLIQNSKAASTGIILFNEISVEVEELKGIFRYLDRAAFTLLPFSRQQVLLTHASTLLAYISSIQNIKKDPGQADNQQKGNILRYFKQTANEKEGFSVDRASLWNSILESLVLAQHKALNDGAGYSAKVKGLDDLVADAAGIKDKLDAVLNTAQQDLGKKGVAVHSKSFNDQAEEYLRQADSWKSWSIFLICLNGVLIISVLSLVLWGLQMSTVTDRIEVGIFGAALVSLVSFGVVLCVRNYFAAKHNEIVNRHKANCLGTYNTFIDSADEERKAAVLLQATQTIFSHQRTGYLSKEAEVSSPNPIVEVIRHLPAGRSEAHAS